MPGASPQQSPKPKGSPRVKANAQTPIPATYQIDIVQRVRVTSNEPLTRDKIDQIKRSLENTDRGYFLDNDKLSLTQTSLEVVKGSSKLSLPSRPHSTSPSPDGPSRQQQQRILFYHAHDPYYGFTNFSPDAVEYQGKVYPTSEHLFQSLKFLPHRPELAEHIRTCSKRPRMAFDEAHRFSPEVRSDWLGVRVEMMDMVLWRKFTQNKHLRDELLSTGDSELVEDSDKDAFWGVGPDGKGKNQLGKALQRLRSKLRDGGGQDSSV